MVMEDDDDKSPETDDSYKIDLVKAKCPERQAERYLAENSIGDSPTIRHYGGRYWVWANGCYRESSEADIRASLHAYLKRRFVNLTAGAINNVETNLRCLANVPGGTVPRWLDGQGADARKWKPHETVATRSHLVNVRLLLKRGKAVRDADPAYFNTSATDYDFVESPPKPENFLSFLDEIFPGDEQAINLLQEWLAYLLTGSTHLQKMLMVIGPPRAGKGILAKVISAVVGRDNVCSPSFGTLGGRFGLAGLVGKSVGIMGDARLSRRDDKSLIVERLLSISGGDAVEVEGKFRASESLRLPTRLVVMSNELPALVEASTALANRFCYLRLTKSFLGEEDPGLADRLVAERAGIFAWALDGWARIHATEPGRFTVAESAAELATQMKALTSPVRSFADDCATVEPGAVWELDAAYRAYREWLSRSGVDNLPTKAQFSKDLLAAFPAVESKRRRNDNPEDKDNRRRILHGIRQA